MKKRIKHYEECVAMCLTQLYGTEEEARADYSFRTGDKGVIECVDTLRAAIREIKIFGFPCKTVLLTQTKEESDAVSGKQSH